MPDVLSNGPSPPPVAGAAPRGPDAARSASDLAGWLGGLLDAALASEDAALARLIAGVVDDLRGAARG